MRIKQAITLFIFCAMTHLAWADLDGTYEDNGDGTYSVEVYSLNGHRYEGTGIRQCDGTFRVNIHDHNDETYSGVSCGGGRCGNYNMTYQDDITGENIGGRLLAE